MKKIVLLLWMLSYILPATAQMNRGVNNGLSRGMNDMMRTNTNEGKKEKKDPIVATMEYIKKELSLDDFQEAAVKSYLLENIAESDKVNATSLNPEEKRQKFIELKNIFDEKTKSILNPEQIALFNNLYKETKEKKKKKKKNKEEEK